MKLTYKDIREEWDNIKDSLKEILFPSDSLEEVYHLCRIKQAFLFTVPEGYIIFREFKNDSGERVLFIWAANCKGLIQKYETDIDELARMIKADKIAFRTTRKGFEKVLSDNWSISYVEFIKKVEYV